MVNQHEPLSVVELTATSDLTYGQVLVRVMYSGICGAQLNEIDGVKGADPYLPHLLGHEGSGVVEDVGPGVKTVTPGDHVVLHWRPSSGLQSETPSYKWDGRTVNAGWVTTFNDLAVVSENRLTVIPNDFDMKLAPLFGCAVTTAMGVINNDAQVKIGQSVVVFGVGGVGLNTIQGADMVSAHPIIGVDVVESKLEMAKQFGMTHGFVAEGERDTAAGIREIVGEQGADVVIDTTGNTSVIEAAYNLTSPNGKTILVGVPRQGDNISIHSLPLHYQKVLTGSHGGSSRPDVEIPRYVQLCKSGKMTLDGLITHEFNLSEINVALDAVRDGATGRCLIGMVG